MTAWAADRFATRFYSAQGSLMGLCLPMGLQERTHSAVQHMYRATYCLSACYSLAADQLLQDSEKCSKNRQNYSHQYYVQATEEKQTRATLTANCADNQAQTESTPPASKHHLNWTLTDFGSGGWQACLTSTTDTVRELRYSFRICLSLASFVSMRPSTHHDATSVLVPI